jgi:hypothetical protein
MCASFPRLSRSPAECSAVAELSIQNFPSGSEIKNARLACHFFSSESGQARTELQAVDAGQAIINYKKEVNDPASWSALSLIAAR